MVEDIRTQPFNPQQHVPAHPLHERGETTSGKRSLPTGYETRIEPSTSQIAAYQAGERAAQAELRATQDRLSQLEQLERERGKYRHTPYPDPQEVTQNFPSSITNSYRTSHWVSSQRSFQEEERSRDSQDQLDQDDDRGYHQPEDSEWHNMKADLEERLRVHNHLRPRSRSRSPISHRSRRRSPPHRTLHKQQFVGVTSVRSSSPHSDVNSVISQKENTAIDLIQKIVPVALATEEGKRSVQESLKRILPYEVDAPVKEQQLNFLRPPPLASETFSALQEGLNEFTLMKEDKPSVKLFKPVAGVKRVRAPWLEKEEVLPSDLSSILKGTDPEKVSKPFTLDHCVLLRSQIADLLKLMSKADWLGTAAAKESKRITEGFSELTSVQILESLKDIQILNTEAAHTKKGGFVFSSHRPCEHEDE